MNIVLITPFIISIIIGYIFGSIPTGYLFCKSKGINIYEMGSGNPGYTNVKRVLGKKEGIKVLLMDILKVIIPIIIIKKFFPYDLYNQYFSSYDETYKTMNNMISLYTGMSAVTGHSYPIFMKFKGGKGIATTEGVMLSFNIEYAVILILIYKLVSKKTKYVSIGSITAVTALSVGATVLSIFNIYPFNYEYNYLSLPACYIITLICIYKHKSNIQRLLDGTENKIR